MEGDAGFGGCVGLGERAGFVALPDTKDGNVALIQDQRIRQAQRALRFLFYGFWRQQQD